MTDSPLICATDPLLPHHLNDCTPSVNPDFFIQFPIVLLHWSCFFSVWLCSNFLLRKKKFPSPHYLPLSPIIVLGDRSKNTNRWISTDSCLKPPSDENSVITTLAFPPPPAIGEGQWGKRNLERSQSSRVDLQSKSSAKDEKKDKGTCLVRFPYVF